MSLSSRMKMLLVPVFAFALTGCSSFQSHFVQRDNPNHEWSGKKLKGVPVKISVPSHLEMQIVEQRYVDSKGQRVPEKDVAGKFTGRYRSSRVVRHELRYSDKVFTVDPQRPGAGLAHPQLTFNETDYLTKLENQITDNTIQETSTLISTLAQAGGLKSVFVGTSTTNESTDGSGSTPAPAEPRKFASIDFVIAETVIDLDDPHFESKVEVFFNTHLHYCPQPMTKSGSTMEVPPPAPSVEPNSATIQPASYDSSQHADPALSGTKPRTNSPARVASPHRR